MWHNAGVAVTQKDIADQLRVSVATVSRSLRHDPAISTTVRGQVLQAAAELGYPVQSEQTGGPRPRKRRASRPRPAGAGSSAKGATFAVLVRHERVRVNTVHERMLAGLSDAAGALDAGLMIHYVREEQLASLTHERSAPAVLRRPDDDGLLLLNRYPESLVAGLAERWPCVSVTYPYHGLPIDAVEVDPNAGMLALASHLHQLGHERLGFLGSAEPRGWSHEIGRAHV